MRGKICGGDVDDTVDEFDDGGGGSRSCLGGEDEELEVFR